MEYVVEFLQDVAEKASVPAPMVYIAAAGAVVFVGAVVAGAVS